MKIKTEDLTGPALDWAVHKAKGRDIKLHMFWEYRTHNNMFHYSTDWSQGGPIIEREGIELLCNVTAEEAKNFIEGSHADWRAAKRPINRNAQSFGPTPLIAAMRCYVASRLGDEVDIPEELK
jgi:hypothetical protein